MWTLDDVRLSLKTLGSERCSRAEGILAPTVLAEKRNSSFPSFPQELDLSATHLFPSAHNLSLPLCLDTALRFREIIQQETVLGPRESEET